MYDLAYIMRNHVLFLLFFLAIFAKSTARAQMPNTRASACVRVPQCVCVCLFVCVLCCVYVWVERRSLHHSQTLSPFVVGSAKPMLRCTVLSTTARTLGARLLTKADCSATAQRTAA